MRVRMSTVLAFIFCACTGANKTRTATFYPLDTLITIPKIEDREVAVGQSDSVVFPIHASSKSVPMIWPNTDNRLTRIKSYDVVAPDSLMMKRGQPWKFVLRLVGISPGETTITLSPEGNERIGSRTFKVRVF
jgi:hypothetical protein